ncbi:MAG: NYN domain-containing protein [Candidatus Omnitrophota bacterium]
MEIPDKLNMLCLKEQNPEVIAQLEGLLVGKVNVYIDYANVRHWSTRLNWHIDIKRLKRFLDSFENIQKIRFYYGTLIGDEYSEKLIEDAKRLKYIVRTKDVKEINISIDHSSIAPQSTDLLKNFIRNSLLREYTIETIEYLNKKFKEMNLRDIYRLKDKKCNFDVEIGSDMLIDNVESSPDTFVLWSGDSDFHDPINDLLDQGKKVILFASTRLIASELNDLRKKGLVIFEIKKIKNFICWNKEKDSKSKRDTSKDAPKR